MKKKLLFIFGFFFIIFNIELFGVPAAPHKIKFTQPDGTIFYGFQRGNENYKILYTTDEYVIKKDSENWWTFAVREDDFSHRKSAVQTADGLVPSIYRVGKDSPTAISKKIKPLRIPKKKFTHNKHKRANKLKSRAGEYTIKSGDEILIVILIQFPDKIASTDANSYNQMISDIDDYIQEQSYGNTSVSGELAVDDWLTSSHPMAFYGANSDNGIDDAETDIFELAREAVTLAHDNGFDFSECDQDNDGFMDDNVHIVIIHSGEDEAATWDYAPDNIWSHQGEIDPNEEIDGVALDRYTMVAENSPLGMFCINFLFDLGAPTLYDADYDFVPVGDWCITADGVWLNDGKTPANLCSYIKMDIDGNPENGYEGWLEPTVLDTNSLQRVSIAKSSNWNDDFGNRSYRIDINEKEFFLLEFRSQLGYDEYIPDNGLVIYHIDENMPDGGDFSAFNDGTPNNTFYRCWVESSDRPNLADRPDPDGPLYAFSDNPERQNKFSTTTIPNSNSNNDEKTGININFISDALSDTMSFILGIPIPEPKYLFSIITDTGDNDGVADTGESCLISITIKNMNSEGVATNLSCKLSTSDTYITFIKSEANFGDIDVNGIKSETFSFLVSANCPENEYVKFDLIFTDIHNFIYTDSFILEINPNQDWMNANIVKTVDIQTREIYASENDVEVICFKITGLLGPAHLKKIVIKNKGNASNTDISSLKIWRDMNNNNYFDKQDSYIITLNWDAANNCWDILNSDILIYSQDTFIITISVAASAPEGKTFQCQIPVGSVELQGYNTAPSSNIMNATYQTISPKKKWTWMVYLAADNDLAIYGKNDLINEMMKIGSDIYTNFIVLSDTGCGYCYLINNGELSPIPLNKINEEWTSKDLVMSDSNVLAEWVKWTMNYFKADNYVLELWGHGEGFKNKSKESQKLFEREVCFDNTTLKYMYMFELKQALENIKSSYPQDKFAIFGIDACLEGLIEYGYELRDFAYHYVASYSTENSDGWEYNYIMNELTNNPDMSAKELASVIVKSYAKRYSEEDVQLNSTLVALDLTKIEDVAQNISNMANVFLSSAGDSYWGQLRLALDGADFLSYQPEGGLSRDLYTILNRISHTVDNQAIKNFANAAKAALDNAIDTYYVNTNHQMSHGLGIYCPVTEIAEYDSSYDTSDPDWTANHKWDDLMRTYFFGEKDTVPAQPNSIISLPDSSTTGNYSLVFDNQAVDNKGLKYLIVEELRKGAILFSDNSNDTGTEINQNLWNVENSWQRSTTVSHSGAASYWTGLTISETGQVITMKNSVLISDSATLEFWAYIDDIDKPYNWLFVEISDNNFLNFERFIKFTGSDKKWQKYTFDISNYKGKNVKVRFRYSGESTLLNGAYIDDIKIYSYNSSVRWDTFSTAVSTQTIDFIGKITDTYIYRVTGIDNQGNIGFWSDPKVINVSNYVYARYEKTIDGESVIIQVLSNNITNYVAVHTGTFDGDIEVPEGALNNNIDTIIIIVKKKYITPGYNPVTKIIDVKLETAQKNFSKKIKFAFQIPVSSIISTDGLTAMYYDATSAINEWKKVEYDPLDISIDAITNKVTVEFSVEHLTFFGVFDESPQKDLSNLRVYPNPFVPSSNSDAGRSFVSGSYTTGIIFDKLSANAKIWIYSITGELVTQSSIAAGANKFQWDVKNQTGIDVASGIYIYVVKDANGSVKTGKLAIVR